MQNLYNALQYNRELSVSLKRICRMLTFVTNKVYNESEFKLDNFNYSNSVFNSVLMSKCYFNLVETYSFYMGSVFIQNNTKV